MGYGCQTSTTVVWNSVYGDLNNINGANDISVIQGGGVPQSQQDYGMTADLGLKLNF